MKTPCLPKFLVAVAFLAGLASVQGHAAHAGHDPALMPNVAPAPVGIQRTSDANTPADAPEPSQSERYGWPTAAAQGQGWLTTPPLPETAYAVVPLRHENWPANAEALELDDLGDVLARANVTPPNGVTHPQLYLWRPAPEAGQPQTVLVPLGVNRYTGGLVWPSLSSTIVLPTTWKSLSSDGRVAGFRIGSNGYSGRGAAVWSSVGGTITDTALGQWLPESNYDGDTDSVLNWSSAAFVVNASGMTLGLEWLRGHHDGSPGLDFEDLAGIRDLEPTAANFPLGAELNEGTHHLLGAGADFRLNPNPNYNVYSDPVADPFLSGRYSLPTALNDRGTAVVLQSGVGQIGLSRLVVLDGGHEFNLGAAFNWQTYAPATGLDFQALTNGAIGIASEGENNWATVMLAPPVVLAVKAATANAPLTLWWAHAVPSQADPAVTGAWTSPAQVEYFSQRQGGTSFVRQKVLAGFARANDRMEIILGDNRLVRDEGVVNLNDRVPNAWRVNETRDINNAGVILAYATCTKRADGSDIPVGEQVSEPVLLVPSLLLLDDNAATGIGAAGSVGGFIPFYGAGRNSINYFQTGHPVLGAVFAGLAVSDVFLVRSLISSGARLIIKGGVALLGADAAEEGTATAINLYEHEATAGRIGGHTISEHITVERAKLVLMAQGKPNGVASIFFDRATAEAAATTVLQENTANISAWLAGSEPTKAFEATLNYTVGMSVTRAGARSFSATAKFVLKRDETRASRYFILTGFPN